MQLTDKEQSGCIAVAAANITVTNAIVVKEKPTSSDEVALTDSQSADDSSDSGEDLPYVNADAVVVDRKSVEQATEVIKEKDQARMGWPEWFALSLISCVPVVGPAACAIRNCRKGNKLVIHGQTAIDNHSALYVCHAGRIVDACIDVVFVGVDIAMLGMSGPLKGAATVAQKGVEVLVESSTKAVVVSTAKESTKAVTKQVALEGAKQAVIQATKEAGKTMSKHAVKHTAKKAAEQALKETGKAVSKHAAKKMAKEAAKIAAVRVAQETGKHVSKHAAKKASKYIVKQAAVEGAKIAVAGISKQTVVVATQTITRQAVRVTTHVGVQSSTKGLVQHMTKSATAQAIKLGVGSTEMED